MELEQICLFFNSKIWFRYKGHIFLAMSSVTYPTPHTSWVGHISIRLLLEWKQCNLFASLCNFWRHGSVSTDECLIFIKTCVYGHPTHTNPPFSLPLAALMVHPLLDKTLGRHIEYFSKQRGRPSEILNIFSSELIIMTDRVWNFFLQTLNCRCLVSGTMHVTSGMGCMTALG